jgi:hypothetical protein
MYLISFFHKLYQVYSKDLNIGVSYGINHEPWLAMVYTGTGALIPWGHCSRWTVTVGGDARQIKPRFPGPVPTRRADRQRHGYTGGHLIGRPGLAPAGVKFKFTVVQAASVPGPAAARPGQAQNFKFRVTGNLKLTRMLFAM